MANLNNMSSEQLRALADKKDRDAQADIVDVQRAGGRIDSRSFEGTAHVDVYGLDVPVYLPRLNNWRLAREASTMSNDDWDGVERLLSTVLGEREMERVTARLSEVNRERNAEWCAENGVDPDEFYTPSTTDMIQTFQDVFGAASPKN